MKYLLLTLLLILTGCEKLLEPEVYEGDLFERENVFYKPNSLEPFDGENIEWHENGQLKERGNYIDGKKDGLWMAYYKNGQLAAKGNYIDGKENGLWVSYYKNGQLLAKRNYIDGKKDGLEELYLDNGRPSLGHPRCYQNFKVVDLAICKKKESK